MRRRNDGGADDSKPLDNVGGAEIQGPTCKICTYEPVAEWGMICEYCQRKYKINEKDKK
jgi:hypothetical protein